MEMRNYVKITGGGRCALIMGSFCILIRPEDLLIEQQGEDYSWEYDNISKIEVSYSIMCMMEKELKVLEKQCPHIEFGSPETDQMNAQIEGEAHEIQS